MTIRKIAFTLATGIAMIAGPALAASDAQIAGYWWDGSVKVSSGVGVSVTLEQGQCLPFVTVAGQLLCAKHAYYLFNPPSDGDYTRDKVVLEAVGVNGAGNTISIGLSDATYIQRVTTPDYAKYIGEAIVDGTARDAAKYLPAPYYATYLIDMTWIASDGSVGLCVRLSSTDSCGGKGIVAPAGVMVRYRQ